MTFMHVRQDATAATALSRAAPATPMLSLPSGLPASRGKTPFAEETTRLVSNDTRDTRAVLDAYFQAAGAMRMALRSVNGCRLVPAAQL